MTQSLPPQLPAMPRRPNSRVVHPIPPSDLPAAPLVGDLAGAGSRYSPREPFCLHERNDDLVMHVPAAGFRNDELEVLLSDNYVLIRGHRRRPLRTAREDASVPDPTHGLDSAIRQSGSGQSFRRIIRLPVNVRSEQAAATLRDGLLTVVVPIR